MTREYYLKHKEEILKKHKEYKKIYRSIPSVIDMESTRRKKYYKNNREKMLKLGARWRKLNKEKIVLDARIYNKTLRNNIFNLLGGAKCKKCGFKDIRALQVDHVNGGGNKERSKSAYGYAKRLNDIKLNPEKYQILCANCNWIKRHENKEVKSKYDKI